MARSSSRRSSRHRRPLRRALGLIGFSRLALLAWAWRNRNDLRGWVGLGRRVPAAALDPVQRRVLAAEARLRAAITADATARAAGLDVVMQDGTPRVIATRGTRAERDVALAKFHARHGNPTAVDRVVDVSSPGADAEPAWATAVNRA